MPDRKPARLLLIALLALTAAVSASPRATRGQSGKGGTTFAPQSAPSVFVQNAYLQALASPGGRFVVGTTGGDPSTPADNGKRLLFGYASNAGSSFSTLRVGNGPQTTDYRLGSTDWGDSGIAPVAPPAVEGAAIRTVWERDGVRVEERVSIAQNADTGRPDTTAIEYTIKNNNASTRTVGLRMMFDTMIGDNDGAPFFIEGSGQLTQEFEFSGSGVPSTWNAYESATFARDSLKARGQLSGGTATPPDRFVVGHWGAERCGGVPGLFESTWAYEVNPDLAVTCDSAVALYYNPLTLGPGQSRTYRTYYGIARAGQAARLELIGMEALQVVQDLKNSVALIQEKPTLFRAFMRSTSGTIENVKARLIATRIEANGTRTPLGTLRPDFGGNAIDVLEQPRRVSLSDNFTFKLPLDWTRGTIELEMRADNYTIDACKEPDGASDCKTRLVFAPMAAPDVRFVGITWRKDGVKHTPVPEDFERAAANITAAFPVASLNWTHPYNIEPTFFAGQPDNIAQFLRLDGMLAQDRTFECLTSFEASCWKSYYIGVLVDPPTTSAVVGMALWIPSDIVSGYLDYTRTLEHEFGHALGREHTDYNHQRNVEPKENCSGVAQLEACFPVAHHEPADGTISQSKEEFGSATVYGYDATTTSRLGPDTPDLMSYGDGSWPSPWTYSHIKDHLAARLNSSSAAASIVPAGGTSLVVSGVISPEAGAGQIESAYVVQAVTAAPAPAPGGYAIRVENAQGQPLGVYSFEPSHPPEGLEAWFTLALPWSAGASRIVLLRGGQVLDARTRSANSPSLSIVYPNGGEQLGPAGATMSWTADDPDGDTLSYVVQYSRDNGSTWKTLVSDWPGTSYELPLDTLAGSGRALLRVLASDGFNTAEDTTDGTFAVEGHAPLARITSPEAGRLYVEDQTLILEGSAQDSEDGQLAGTALTWSSDLNGTLGTGRSLAINAANLAEGTHLITLIARDRDGQIDVATTTVRISRARPALPSNLLVEPQQLRFVATRDGEPTRPTFLSMRNLGDGALSWSASADRGWIRVSAQGGIAPTDIVVAADPAGLAVGTYTGHVTISAPGALNGTRSVEVTLVVAPPHQTFVSLLASNARPGGSPGPTATPTTRPPNTPTATATATATPTSTPTATATATPTATATATPTSTPTDTPGQPPAAPDNLQALALDAHQIRLDWNDNSTDENGFVIYDGGVYVDTVPAGTTSYTIGGLAPDSYRCYHVYAFNDYGDSAWTEYACATTSPALEYVNQVGGFYAEAVAVRGGYAYVAGHEAGLRVIDISNPASPFEVGFYDTPGNAYDVALSGNYAYVADDTAGLRVIDISNPADPFEVGFYDTPGYAYGVALAGSYAYVADTTAGLGIVNISDPYNPQSTGTYSTSPELAFDVAVAGGYAYLATGAGGLAIVDVAAPANPTTAGGYDTPGTAFGVAAAGGYAYVADYEAGVRVVNVASPASAWEAGYYDTPGGAEFVAVAGGRAYVGDGLEGLRVLDVTSASSPQEIAAYDTPEFAQGAAVSGGYIYVADGTDGLIVLRLNV